MAAWLGLWWRAFPWPPAAGWDVDDYSMRSTAAMTTFSWSK